jgi:hypothetical protein
MMRTVKISTETVIPKVSGEENALPISTAKEAFKPTVSGKEVSPPVSLYYEAYKQ